MKLGLKQLLQRLRDPRSPPERLRLPQHRTRGIHLFVDALEAHKDATVPLSYGAAMAFAGKIDPSTCVALQSGRLARVDERGGDRRYELQLDGTGYLLLTTPPKLFFNFVIGRWQPACLAKAAYTSGSKELLYVAFRPAAIPGPSGGGPALFVKLGYRELPEDEGEAELVSYVEKKTQLLRLTNAAEAGIFIFEVPSSHSGFARRCRAAEASLKYAFPQSDEVVATPTNDRGEVDHFSTSLEYFFVEAPSSSCGVEPPLVGLTRLLRTFAGTPTLSPWRVAAAEGEIRSGRKRLCAWPATL